MGEQKPGLTPEQYRALVEQVAERVWKRWLAEQRLAAQRKPADKARRKP